MRKEILCVTHKYPPVIGGMEKQSFELINGLKEHFTVHVIAYEDEGNKALWFYNLPSLIKKTLSDHPGISLIHLNDGLMGVASLWLQKYTDIPVVVTYHGLDITFPSKLFQSKVISRLSNYDGAICVSDATRQACLDRGFKKDTTFSVLNGVDKDMAAEPVRADFKDVLFSKYGVDIKGKRILMTMGRPVKRKGFSWFLRNVMPHLEDDIIFLMVGPLNENPSLGEKAILSLPGSLGHNTQLMLGITSDAPDVLKEVKENDRVFHLGKVPYEDLLQVLALAEVFVMPNIKVHGDAEGFGLVALEASMRGTPVLASGIEGITDAIHNEKNGWLIESQKPQVWIDKIHKILADKNKLAAFSEASKNYTLANYSWEKMTRGYVEVFNRFISSSTV